MLNFFQFWVHKCTMCICAEKYEKMKCTIQNFNLWMQHGTLRNSILVSACSVMFMCLVTGILLTTVDVGIRQWNCDVRNVLSSLSSLCVFTACFKRGIVSCCMHKTSVFNWGQRYSVKMSAPRGTCTALKCTNRSMRLGTRQQLFVVNSHEEYKIALKYPVIAWPSGSSKVRMVK